MPLNYPLAIFIIKHSESYPHLGIDFVLKREEITTTLCIIYLFINIPC